MRQPGLVRIARAASRVVMKAAQFAVEHDEAVVRLAARVEAVLDDHRLALSIVRIADRLLDVAVADRERLPEVLHDVDRALRGELASKAIALGGSAARFVRRQPDLASALADEARVLLDGDALVPAAGAVLAVMPQVRDQAGEINATALHIRSAAEKSAVVGAALRAARSGARVLDAQSAAVVDVLGQGQRLLETDLPAAGIAFGTAALKLAVAQADDLGVVLARLTALAGDAHAADLLRATSGLLAALLANSEAIAALAAGLEAWLVTSEPAGWLAALNKLGLEHREALRKLGADLLAIVEQPPHAAAFTTLTDTVRLAWLESDALATGLAGLRALDVISESLSLDGLSSQLRVTGQSLILVSYALAGTSARGDTVRPPRVPAGDVPACPTAAPPSVLDVLTAMAESTAAIRGTLGEFVGALQTLDVGKDVSTHSGNALTDLLGAWGSFLTSASLSKDRLLKGAGDTLQKVCAAPEGIPGGDPMTHVKDGLGHASSQVRGIAHAMYAIGMSLLDLAAALAVR